MKTTIFNTLGGKSYPMTLPCDASSAQTFATNFLVGEWTIWEQKSEGGSSAVVTQSKKALCYGFNKTTEARVYLGFNIALNKSESDIRAALVGKTFNGVLIDEVAMISIAIVNH